MNSLYVLSGMLAFVANGSGTLDGTQSNDSLANFASEQMVKEDAALRVYAADQNSGAWGVALSEMHGNATHTNTAPEQLVKEDAALRVYAADQNSGAWGVALSEMHENAGTHLEHTSRASQMPSFGPDSDHRTHVGKVTYLEYFQNEATMERAIHALAKRSDASIVRTNRDIFGKRIAKYLVEAKMPQGAVLATCHNTKDCQIRPDLSACDSRFNDRASYVRTRVLSAPALRGSRASSPQPLCHSPPTTTDMVYTFVKFEDASTEWVMWACHRHNLKTTMCHVTDVVAVNTDALLRVVANQFV